MVDFENLPELPAGIFDLAPHKEISLKAVTAVNTLLPPDHHYKVDPCPYHLGCQPHPQCAQPPSEAASATCNFLFSVRILQSICILGSAYKTRCNHLSREGVNPDNKFISRHASNRLHIGHSSPSLDILLRSSQVWPSTFLDKWSSSCGNVSLHI